MRITSIVLTAVAGWILSGAALAQVPPPASTSGLYLGGGAGRAKAAFKNDDFTTNGAFLETKEETDVAFKLFAGWAFGRNVGIELAYADLGKFAYQYEDTFGNRARLNYKATAWTLSGVATIPVKGDFSALLRLGVSANKAERSGVEGAPIVPAPPAANKTRLSPLFGLGAQYDLDRKTAFRFEFEHYGRFGEAKGAGTAALGTNFPDTTGRVTIYTWMLSGLYRFY
jgi:OmpA-OmpF porin, OOP family